MKLKHISLSVMVIGTTLAGQAFASGYHFGSQSISAQGTAHASGAEAADASTVFYNPAGLSRLEGTTVSGGVTLVMPDSSFTDNGSRMNTVGAAASAAGLINPGVTSSAPGGNNGGNYVPSAVAAPSLYLSHKLNDKIGLGFGLFVPFGAQLDYDPNWVGRYALQSIKLETINLNPSMSYKLDDHHSFGFGLSAEYMKASLQKATDVAGGVANSRAALLKTIAGGGAAGAAAAAKLAALAPVLTAQAAAGGFKEGTASMDADDWGFGFNLGYMFTLDENTRFGLAYRSNIKHSLNGNAVWVYPGALAATEAVLRSQHDNAAATLDVDTPESVSANFFHQLNPKVALMGDLTWTRHSRLDTLDIKLKNSNNEGDMVINQKWRDTYKVSLGGNYKYSDNLLLRTGIAYDQSPVTDEKYTHPALPDSDRYQWSFGANYKLDKNSSIDFAYSYIWFKDATVNYTDSCLNGVPAANCTGNGETTKGTYKTNLQMVGLQYNYSF